MNNSFDKGPDIEFLAGDWEDEQASLADWERQAEADEAYERLLSKEEDLFFDLQEMEEERKFRDRYQPWSGTSLNGRQLLIDVETGDICDENGKPLNSCDSLAVIDGGVDENE
jgi:hypothetical protein